MLGEVLEKKIRQVKGEQYSTNFEANVDDCQALYKVRKEKCEIEQELADLKSINMQREKLKMENEKLENLKREIVMVKKWEVSRKIKLGAVAVEALIDTKGKLRKYNYGAEVERTSSDMADVVEVVLKGTEQAVEKTDQQLRELTSTYSVLPLKSSQQSVLKAGKGLLLEQIRRMTGAAIGFKDGTFYIFGSERERLEANVVIKNELKLCSSSSWRRWSFFRKSSVVGWSRGLLCPKSGVDLVLQPSRFLTRGK